MILKEEVIAMTQPELEKAVRRIIWENGLATKRYLYDIFINHRKRNKYFGVSSYRLEQVLKNLLKGRIITATKFSKTTLYNLR